MNLPLRDFTWLNDDEIESFDLNAIDLDGEFGYIIQCDLKYPKKLHKSHHSLPLAPDVLEVTFEDLSPFAKSALLSSINKKQYKDVKLLTTFGDRKDYVVHCKNLKLYLDLGLKLKKIHKILKFRQDKFIAPYIEKCTEARKKSNTKFDQDRFKLLVSIKKFYRQWDSNPRILMN